MTQERIMFSNPTPSELRLSPAATMSDEMRLPAITPPLHCAFILQPATPPKVVAFESWTISAPICLNRFTHRFSLHANPRYAGIFPAYRGLALGFALDPDSTKHLTMLCVFTAKRAPSGMSLGAT